MYTLNEQEKDIVKICIAKLLNTEKKNINSIYISGNENEKTVVFDFSEIEIDVYLNFENEKTKRYINQTIFRDGKTYYRIDFEKPLSYQMKYTFFIDENEFRTFQHKYKNVLQFLSYNYQKHLDGIVTMTI